MESNSARVRATGLVVALGLSWLPVLWLVEPALTTEPRTFDDGLGALLAGALLAGWLWCSAAAGALALELALTGAAARTASRAPRCARLAVAALCGAGSLAAFSSPATADPVGAPAPGLHVLSGLTLPDRPEGGESVDLHRRVVTVQSGDTLSELAAGLQLDWHSWYVANREVVGPDPDLIQPGQRLVVPSHTTHEGAHR